MNSCDGIHIAIWTQEPENNKGITSEQGRKAWSTLVSPPALNGAEVLQVLPLAPTPFKKRTGICHIKNIS
jgi:hypothetical protein